MEFLYENWVRVLLILGLLATFIFYFPENWFNLLLVIGSFTAFYVYFRQKYDVKKSAAILIVLQIDESRKRMEEMLSLLTNQNLNSVAIYETLPIIDTNYWERNKHLFVEDIKHNSIETLDKFYKYVVLIQEQQLLIKQQQKQHLLQTQTSLGKGEYQLLIETFGQVTGSTINSYFSNELPKFDENLFWKIYATKQPLLKNIINNNCFTEYISKQTGSTASTIFKSYSLLEVTGCQGYRKLCEIAKM